MLSRIVANLLCAKEWLHCYLFLLILRNSTHPERLPVRSKPYELLAPQGVHHDIASNVYDEADQLYYLGICLNVINSVLNGCSCLSMAACHLWYLLDNLVPLEIVPHAMQPAYITDATAVVACIQCSKLLDCMPIVLGFCMLLYCCMCIVAAMLNTLHKLGARILPYRTVLC